MWKKIDKVIRDDIEIRPVSSEDLEALGYDLLTLALLFIWAIVGLLLWTILVSVVGSFFFM